MDRTKIVIQGRKPIEINRLIHGTLACDSDRQAEADALLDGVLAQGCYTFDTAHGYSGGRGEKALGNWMKKRGNRGEVFIISKCCHYNEYRRRLTPYDIGSDLLNTLAKLQSPYVDLYMLHQDDPDAPVGPLVEAFYEHITAGRMRAWGVSNWTWQRVEEAMNYAAQHDLIPCAAASSHYSLAVQYEKAWGGCPFGDEGVSETITGEDMAEARRFFAQTQLPFFAYSSLGRGLLSGAFTAEKLREHPECLDPAGRKAYCHPQNLERLERCERLSREKGCSVSQLALAWMLAQPMNLALLVGVRTPEEYTDDARAFSVSLTQAECAWLNLECDTL